MATTTSLQKESISTKNAVVFGGSGVAGQALICQLASTPEFRSVVLIVRKPLTLPPQACLTSKFDKGSNNDPANTTINFNWKKFQTVIIQDVADVKSYAHHLEGITVAFYTLGSKWKMVSQEEFRRVEVDLLEKVGSGLRRESDIQELHFLSATNTSPYSLNPISRIKATAEGILIGLKFPNLVIYRPGYFLVPNPTTGELSTGDWLFGVCLDRWHWLSLDISILARVMVEAATQGREGGKRSGGRGCDVRILEQAEIVKIDTLCRKSSK